MQTSAVSLLRNQQDLNFSRSGGKEMKNVSTEDIKDKKKQDFEKGCYIEKGERKLKNDHCCQAP